MALPLSKGTPMKKKAMVKKEINFMKKNKAPKSMISHEYEEHGMKKPKGFKRGGMAKKGC